MKHKSKIAKLTKHQTEALVEGLTTYFLAVPILLGDLGTDRAGLSTIERATASLHTLMTLLGQRGLPEAIIELHFHNHLVTAFSELKICAAAARDRASGDGSVPAA